MASIKNQLENPSNPNSPIETPRKRRQSLTELWFKDQQLKHAIYKMQQHQTTSHNELGKKQANLKTLTLGDDLFSLIGDENLQLILSKVPVLEHELISAVCKRWYYVLGKIRRSICLLDWGFLISGRLIDRFTNLSEVNLVPACFRSSMSSGIVVSHKIVKINVDTAVVSDGLIGKGGILGCELIDNGLKLIGSGCSNLRKLCVVNASEEGLRAVAENCDTLQELEVHCCEDMVLRSFSKFRNLQILKLSGYVEGLYESVVSDIGLTILAQGCRRLVKLELSGCEGSYDGIKAIGQCCQMLEELTICGHRMSGGWLAALSYCSNLKTLKLQSCESIDVCPGPDEHLGSCPTLEELYLERCQVREKEGVRALFLVCKFVKEISFLDCWGLDDDLFRYAAVCRRVKSISLEGCSLLTTIGLDSVVQNWKELQTLKVVSCNNIQDAEITPELATLFSVLKELKWRPNSRSLLATSLSGTGVGKKGGRFFKRV
ncbi:F-box protein At5g51380-like [Silene latifolia]|uniref:F-box protein At5g51380-like n=1 Tax=Silene latifolia TaxID=37657 RepID=UPI003D770342